MPLTLLTTENYLEFLENVPLYSTFQSLEMANLLQKRGYKTDFVGLKKEGDIKVAGLLYSKPMTGGLHMEINSGPVVLDPNYLKEFYQELSRYAKDNNALQLLVKPYDTYQRFTSHGEPDSSEETQLIKDFTDNGFSHGGLTTGYPGGEPDWHYLKDLSSITTLEELRKSFTKKGKALAKKSQSFGIKVKKLERSELHLFKEITEQTSERRDYQDKSLTYYQDFYDSFGDKAEFLIATLNFNDYLTNLQQSHQNLSEKIATKEQTSRRKNELKELKQQLESFDTRISEAKTFIEQYGEADIPLACSLFVFDKTEAIYLFSGSLIEFNKFYAPLVLQEYALMKSINRHITTYNFLGITGIFDGNDGVLGFKQNFNGYINRKMGTFRYYPHPLKFKVISLLKKILRR